MNLDDAIRCRNRFLFALNKGKTDRARSILLRHYLPALRDLQATSGPDSIQHALTVRTDRLTVGLQILDYDSEALKITWKYGEEKHDTLALKLLAELEVLYDCTALQYEGKPTHPISYLMDRIDAKCPYES